MKTKRRIPYGVINGALFAVSALAMGGARADTWTDPDTGYKWNYHIRGDVAEISKSNSEAISPKPTGTVTIPTSLGGKPVTSLGASAFKGCSGLVGVAIPASVTNIGSSAFRNCSGLVNVAIPDGVTRIGGSAFLGCSGLMHVTIPTSVTNIGSSAFKDCESLTSVVIPQYVCRRKIPTIFPASYQSITNVVLLADVTNIGAAAFKGCSGLVNIFFEGDAPELDGGAFADVGSGCTVYVGRHSIGWGVAIPGTWEGLRIEYSGAVEAEASNLWPLGVVGAVPAATASVYDGYLYDRVGAAAGMIQVKVGKPNAKTGLASVKVTVIGRDGRKKHLRAAGNGTTRLAADGPSTILCGDTCVVTLGTQGMCGRYGGYTIDGARNVFTSKDAADKAIASATLGKWQGVMSVAWPGVQGWNGLSVILAAKGKAKAAGTLASGTKVSATSQLIIGEEWGCVPVVCAKKNERIAFNVWFPLNGQDARSPSVVGLGNAVVGRPGTLKAGAKFQLGATMGDAMYEAYLPDGVPVGGGAKWTLPKAGKVVYRRGTTEVDATKLGENPSALKLTYKTKDGSFKGSFKAYADVNGKPKATTVKVAGVLVNGIGYGTATAKGANAPVMVE